MRSLVLCLLATGCISFGISDKDFKKEFEHANIVPVQSQLLIGERTMNYVYTKTRNTCLIVFIHGSPGSWNSFIDYFKIDSLLQRADIISIDRPGFGGSGHGVAEPSMEKQAFYIHNVVQQFNHPVKILVGHSLGGPVQARMAMDYPGSYDGLIMLAPSIDPAQEKKEWYRKLIKSRIGGWLTPKDFGVSNDEIMPLKNELTEMIPLWSNIITPTIVLHGTKDNLVPVENASFASAMMADSLIEVRLLEGVDHFIVWSHQAEIIQAINDLIKFTGTQ